MGLAASFTSLDWEPVHWGYGQLGLALSRLSPPPEVLYAGERLPAGSPQAVRTVFSPRRVRRIWTGGRTLPLVLARETQRDINRGARVVIDATLADLGRLVNPARKQALGLRQSGVVRVVIWDGAHHLSTLCLEPDVMIVPVLRGAGGRRMVCHGRLKDAVPLEDLLQLLSSIGWRGWVLGVPRLLTLAKADRSVDYWAREALHSIVRATPASRARRPACRRVWPDGWLFDGRELVLDPGGPRAELFRTIVPAKKQGANTVWAAPRTPSEQAALYRLCRSKGMALRIIGHPEGTAEILRKRLIHDLREAIASVLSWRGAGSPRSGRCTREW